jgi:hypothetical protein
LAGTLLRDFEAAREARGMFNSQYEDVARLVLPSYQMSFIGDYHNPGAERGADMFDVTASTALFRFAAAMESMLTPRNGKWHRFTMVDPNLMKKRAVALWCDQVNDLLFHYRYSPTANYQSQQHDGYVGIGAFGTAGLFVDSLRGPGARGLRYKNLHLGEMYLAENHQGIVDTVYRRTRMTLRQVAQRWGEDALGDKLKGILEKKPEEHTVVIHCVRPREDLQPERIDIKGMPFASYYVLEEVKTILEEGGYRTFPVPTSRYMTAPSEIYGRSPAMMVLPSIKVLNEEKKTVLKQGHRIVDPVLLAHDDGVLNGFSLKPGAINAGAVSAEGRPLVHALPTGNLTVSKELMDDERGDINDAFLVSLFQILVESPQMTATEVLERAREKGALLSPTMGRFQSESLGPLILREYDVLKAQGLLPPPPPEVVEAQAEWKVEFDAPLNRAMRAEEGAGLQRSVQFAMEVAQATQDPSVMDVFDFDVALPDLADINAVPFRWIADPAVVAAKRKQRQNAQAVQHLVDSAPAIASTLASVSPKGTQAAGG